MRRIEIFLLTGILGIGNSQLFGRISFSSWTGGTGAGRQTGGRIGSKFGVNTTPFNGRDRSGSFMYTGQQTKRDRNAYEQNLFHF